MSSRLEKFFIAALYLLFGFSEEFQILIFFMLSNFHSYLIPFITFRSSKTNLDNHVGICHSLSNLNYPVRNFNSRYYHMHWLCELSELKIRREKLQMISGIEREMGRAITSFYLWRCVPWLAAKQSDIAINLCTCKALHKEWLLPNSFI